MELEDKELICNLCKIIDQVNEGQRIKRDSLTLPESENEDLEKLKESIVRFAGQFNDNYSFIMDVAGGRLDTIPPKKNSLANPFKQLHADLLHLTWQIKQISEGDYDQKVSFSGDFSDSINKMILSLREKQRISELNLKYLSELKDLNSMKDRFFSIIAHDLKNPFAGLLGFSDILVSELKDNNYDSALEYAEILKDMSEQGYKLLVNLLEWSRSQLDVLKITIAPVSLFSTVEECKAILYAKARQKGIQIVCEECRDHYVMADVNMLNTVVRNLLSNALKFTETDGKITLNATSSDGYVLFSISDTGVGIKDEDISKLFRIDSNFSTKGTNSEEGTGLGLILCKEFVCKMGGEISVKSRLGEGSTFTLKLPEAIGKH